MTRTDKHTDIPCGDGTDRTRWGGMLAILIISILEVSKWQKKERNDDFKRIRSRHVCDACDMPLVVVDIGYA